MNINNFIQLCITRANQPQVHPTPIKVKSRKQMLPYLNYYTSWSVNTEDLTHNNSPLLKKCDFWGKILQFSRHVWNTTQRWRGNFEPRHSSDFTCCSCTTFGCLMNEPITAWLFLMNAPIHDDEQQRREWDYSSLTEAQNMSVWAERYYWGKAGGGGDKERWRRQVRGRACLSAVISED